MRKGLIALVAALFLFHSIVFAEFNFSRLNRSGFPLNLTLSQKHGIDIYGDHHSVPDNPDRRFIGQTFDAKPIPEIDYSKPKRKLRFRFWETDDFLTDHPDNHVIAQINRVDDDLSTLLKEIHRIPEITDLENRYTHGDRGAHNYLYIERFPTRSLPGQGVYAELVGERTVLRRAIVPALSRLVAPKIRTEIELVAKQDEKRADGSIVRHFEMAVISRFVETPFPTLHLHAGDVEKVECRMLLPSGKEIVSNHFRAAGPDSLQAIVRFDVPVQEVELFRGKLDQGVARPMAFLGLKAETKIYFQDGSVAFSEKAHSEVNHPPVQIKQRPTGVRFSHPREMLDTEQFALQDRTDAEKEVHLDGEPLDPEAQARFLSGAYTFPLIGEDRVYSFSIRCRSGEGVEQVYSDHILVYSTKPRLQLKSEKVLKQNRSAVIHGELILSEYARSAVNPEIRSLEIQGELKDQMHIQQNRGASLRFSPLQPGLFSVQANLRLQVPSERIQRNDIPSGYHEAATLRYSWYVAPDLPPALILFADKTAIDRNDRLVLHYEAASVDGDSVSPTDTPPAQHRWTLHRGDVLLHDDATPPTLQNLSLGTYRVTWTVTESMRGDMDPSRFGLDPGSSAGEIHSASIREGIAPRHSESFDFQVANLAPLTQLFLDLPTPLEPIDLTVVTDARDIAETISRDRIDWINAIRKIGGDATLHHDDRFVYTDSTQGFTTYEAGTGDPPLTLRHSDNGYRGILHRISITNEPILRDDGSYVAQPISETVEQERVNTSGGTAHYIYRKGKWHVKKSWGTRQLPERIVVMHRGSPVTLYKTHSTNQSDPEPSHVGREGEIYLRAFRWTAHYSGVYHGTRRVWQPRYVSVDNYVGHYSGTLSKQYTKPFEPKYRPDATGIRIYIGAQPDPNDAYDLVLGSDLEAAKQELLAYLQSKIPSFPGNTVLIDTDVSIHSASIDPEQDPIRSHPFQCTHDPAVFDDPMPLYRHPEDSLPTRFPFAGLYRIEGSVYDIPNQQQDFSENSNIAVVEITAHRRPVADFSVRTMFEAGGDKYQLEIDDRSYDPDFRTSRDDRGIRDRLWIYTDPAGKESSRVPTHLTPGTHRLRLKVRDVYGVWSAPKEVVLRLKETPQIQLQSFLQAVSPFTLHSIPASEALYVTGLETRYHLPHAISVRLHPRSSAQSEVAVGALTDDDPAVRSYRHEASIEIARLDWSTAESIGKDHYRWRDVRISIPEEYADGRYAVAVVAFLPELGDSPAIDGNQINHHGYRVDTPISVRGEVTNGPTFAAETTTYAKEVTVIAFDGTPYERRFSLSRIDDIHWKLEAQNDGNSTSGNNSDPSRTDLDRSSGTNPAGTDSDLGNRGSEISPAPSGTYRFRFVARTAAGKEAEDIVTAEHFALQFKRVITRGYWNLWSTARYMGYEKIVVEAEIDGEPDTVEMRLSPELESMEYVNRLGQRYRYRDEFGFEVQFPVRLEQVSPSLWRAEYILPLAPSTLNTENRRLRPAYEIRLTARKGNHPIETQIPIEITGNIHDRMEIQPELR